MLSARLLVNVTAILAVCMLLSFPSGPVSAASYVVDTIDDDPTVLKSACEGAADDCSLRGAITRANAASTPGDVITFDAGVFAPGTIPIANVLPALTGGGDTIDGTGASVLIDTTGETGVTTVFNCLNVSSAGNTVKGLQMTDCAVALSLNLNVSDNNVIGPSNLLYDNVEAIRIGASGASGNSIVGNKIGTTADGSAVHPEGANGAGITIFGADNTVGGMAAADRNIISGSIAGTAVSINTSLATGNVVIGNYIGSSADGLADIGNANGVTLNGASNNTIGGTNPGEGNLISGNDNFNLAVLGGSNNNTVAGNIIGPDVAGGSVLINGTGVDISTPSTNNTIGPANVISDNSVGVNIHGNGATGNIVKGNLIGTNLAGTSAVPNSSDGVRIEGGAGLNTIGGVSLGDGNEIAFNSGDGVFVSSGDGNLIQSNSIHDNTGLGIDLGTNGVTANDVNTGDADTGANNLQNFPVLTGVTLGAADVTVDGTLDSALSTSFDIQFFSSPSCDASGNGEGAAHLGTFTGSTDGSGDLTFSALLPVVVPPGRFITATATDPSGNTSEFSACIPSVDDADDDDDGFEDVAEASIGTGSQDPCGNDGWPAELVDNNNILNIGDFNSFTFPLRGNGSFNKFGHPVPDAQDPNIARWNLDSAGAGATTIDIGDINAINPAVLASTARPPMFGGQPAFFTNGGQCPFPP